MVYPSNRKATNLAGMCTLVWRPPLCAISQMSPYFLKLKKKIVCVHGQGVFVHVRVCEFIQVSAGAHRDLRHQNLA